MDSQAIVKTMQELNKPFLTVLERIADGVEAAVKTNRQSGQNMFGDTIQGDVFQNDEMYDAFTQTPLESPSPDLQQQQDHDDVARALAPVSTQILESSCAHASREHSIEGLRLSPVLAPQETRIPATRAIPEDDSDDFFATIEKQAKCETG